MNIQKSIVLLLFASLFSIEAFSQEKEREVLGYVVYGKDTILVGEIPPAYKKYNPKDRKKGKAWRDYYRLVHNFAKTYPYALLAKEKIEEADTYLNTNKLTKRKKDKYLKDFEKDLFKTFEKPLRGLTYSQGRLLLRLIDREVGLSSYSIIKSYKGGIAAGFWQGVAKLFGSDMKKPYDKFGEDKSVEELVVLYQEGEFAYLYFTIFGKPIPRPATAPKQDFKQNFNPTPEWNLPASKKK